MKIWTMLITHSLGSDPGGRTVHSTLLEPTMFRYGLLLLLVASSCVLGLADKPRRLYEPPRQTYDYREVRISYHLFLN
ncbi:hypothetical protein E2C01_101842 [Portunus trituberculatus]|uniref:Uncharacterized protein n=1 Tax=Portunus trituberculatus TaxID=210409 RepID=A0A5B7KAU7_PORTR|nr:hypothetical protein [Portunus trituberculatus]